MATDLKFWAKTFDLRLDEQPKPSAPIYKPVLHHLLDVAAVARVFLIAQNERANREARLVGLENDDYIRLLSFFAGLHDLGKYSRAFQAKRPDLWPERALGAYPKQQPAGPNHWITTALLLRDGMLNERLSRFLPTATPGYDEPLIAAIAGHHGRAPKYEELKTPWKADTVCLATAARAFDRLAAITEATPVDLDDNQLSRLSWRLSGLTILADWVGSDAAFFGPEPCDAPLKDYWARAQENALRALVAKGLTPSRPVSSPSLVSLAPRAAAAPRPMQTKAGELTLTDGPQLILIEDATGSGKTEAAMLIAARLLAAGRAEGVYVALPTMATANAMYERLKTLADGLFAANGAAAPSLILSHGQASLARALAKLAAQPLGDGEKDVAASCNDWIADDRRRAFFADVGAGTIDQAFLAVLPKKHLTLRQYALAGRVLIVDEAHCFDAYMREEFAPLLQLHAMNGGSAIVLSATLSVESRRQAAAAFFRGLDRGKKQTEAQARACASEAYPLLTLVDSSGVTETATGLAPNLAREVDLVRLDDRSAAQQAAIEAAQCNAAVLVICNAVDEAIGAHSALAAVRPADTVHLFHARFAQGDRLAIETAVLRRFGRDAGPHERAGHILVATQVVEQSLDLDFDLVISDLAPIDLLIQRAGRLWRHMDVRPASTRPIERPRLMIVSPDPLAVTERDWLGPSLGRAAGVYDHAGIMWRSARAIFGAGRLRTPEDLRPMIEQVYAGDEVPSVLAAAANKGEGKEGAARTLGALNVISLDKGYDEVRAVSADEDIGTRLGQPTVRVRLARRVDGVLVPWCRVERAPLHVEWALSELKVRAALWGQARHPADDDELHLRARKSWSEWDDGIALAEVEADGRMRLTGGDFQYDAGFGPRKL